MFADEIGQYFAAVPKVRSGVEWLEASSCFLADVIT